MKDVPWMSPEIQQAVNQCQPAEDFSRLLCVEFTVTFTVTCDCEVTDVECLGPCEAG